MDKLGSSGKDSMHKFYNKQNSIIDLFEEAEKHKSNSSSNLGQHLEDDGTGLRGSAGGLSRVEQETNEFTANQMIERT
jgi:hypothetical protein